MSILAVVAHPDDEVLGAGGALARLTAEGVSARACILVADVDVRTRRPRSEELREDLLSASALLGLSDPILGGFPNIRLNTVPHLEIVQFIEEAMVATGATVIMTHHPGDLNNDHVHVSMACQAAVRLFQRRDNVKPLQGFYFMEILSSTDWSFRGGGEPFQPDTFIEIGAEGVNRKIRALNAYRGVMREYPHPRSREALAGLAAFRGGQGGMQYAEAFQTAFRAIRQGQSTGLLG